MGNGSNGQKIPVATVLRVEKLQEGSDEKLPVAVPIRIDEAQGVLISYDEELSMLNLEIFGHHNAPEVASLETQRDFKNNCLKGLARSLSDYLSKMVHAKRKSQAENILININSLLSYLTGEQTVNAQEVKNLVDSISKIKEMIETIKKEINDNFEYFSFTRSISLFLGRGNGTLYEILSNYTSNNRDLMNSYLGSTSTDNAVSHAGVYPS